MILSDSQGQKKETTFSADELCSTFAFYIDKIEPLLRVSKESLDSSLIATQGSEGMDWSRVIAQRGTPRFARYWHF